MDVLDAQKYTPLHYAAMHGYRAALEVLLEAGADVTRMSKDKASPLDLATAKGHKGCVEEIERMLRGASPVFSISVFLFFIYFCF